jgi:hypothetical protein
MADPHAPLISGGGWRQVEVTRQWRAHTCARAVLWTSPLAAGGALLLFAETNERMMCWMGLGVWGALLVGLIGFRTLEKPAVRTIEERIQNTNKRPNVLY